MRTTVNIHDAKTHLSRLIERVEHGEEIVIARAGRPVALLQPIAAPARRQPGSERIVIHDNFDDPMPDFADIMTELAPTPRSSGQ